MSQNQKPNYTFALIVVFIVCFLIGFVTTMNNSMIAFCSQAFNLTAQDGQYVNTAFYGAYILAIPFSLLMSKIGYKATLILGLAVVGIGFVINAMGIIKARKKPLTIWSNEELSLAPETIGLAGSPTQPGALFSPDLRRGAAPLGSELETAADKILELVQKAGV